MIAFEFATHLYRLSDDQATLLAESLRNYANGKLADDVALGQRLSGNAGWTDGALALADFTEEALVGNVPGALPLEGKAAESMFWALRLMHGLRESADPTDMAALRDALGMQFVA